ETLGALARLDLAPQIDCFDRLPETDFVCDQDPSRRRLHELHHRFELMRKEIRAARFHRIEDVRQLATDLLYGKGAPQRIWTRPFAGGEEILQLFRIVGDDLQLLDAFVWLLVGAKLDLRQDERPGLPSLYRGDRHARRNGSHSNPSARPGGCPSAFVYVA